MELNIIKYIPFLNGQAKYSKLLNTPEKITAKLFFKILKVQNQELKEIQDLEKNLNQKKSKKQKKSQSQNLSLNEALNLLNPRKVRISKAKLADFWIDLTEEYFKRSDPVKYKSNLKKLISIDRLSNEVQTCIAAIQLHYLSDNDDNYGNETLLHFGYNIVKDGEKKIKSRLLTKKTKLKLKVSAYDKKQSRRNEIETIDFWEFVDNIELSRGQPLIDIESIKLDRWIAIVNNTRNTNKRKQQLANKKNNKKK